VKLPRYRGATDGALVWRLLALNSGAGQARGALRVWNWWEHLSERVWPIPPIPGTASSVLRMRLVPHRGTTIRLADGTLVCRGARVGQLHLDNGAAFQLTQKTSWRLEGAIISDLRALASWLEQQPVFATPIAFHGRTFLGRGAQRLGFTCAPCPPTPYIRLFRFYLHGLMVLYSREGWKRMRHGRAQSLFPCDIWMSASELLIRYGPIGQRSVTPAASDNLTMDNAGGVR
jgi:hypothetical protein